jgi:hypothetical protein
MDVLNQDRWLLGVGALYFAVSFSCLLTRPLSFDPLGFAVMPAALAVAVVVALKLSGVGFHWWAVAAFAGWMGLVAWLELLVVHAASAAV